MHGRKWNSKYTESLKQRAEILEQNAKGDKAKEQATGA